MPTATVPKNPLPSPLDELVTLLKAHIAPADPPPLLVPAEEAARLIGCSRASFYRGLAKNEIPASVDTPGGPRWKRSDLLKYVEKLK